jgi:hypothetical protein
VFGGRSDPRLHPLSTLVCVRMCACALGLCSQGAPPAGALPVRSLAAVVTACVFCVLIVPVCLITPLAQL